eukprot:6517051-Pyramimonas_sp.AAC.1
MPLLPACARRANLSGRLSRQASSPPGIKSSLNVSHGRSSRQRTFFREIHDGSNSPPCVLSMSSTS